MAIYIQIRKAMEDDSLVIYRFGPVGDLVGSVCVDKDTGEVELLELEGGRESFYLPRVARVMKRHFEAVEFPDDTCYAA